MSQQAYLALYRRLRPRRFSEVVGQEHVVRALRNQVRSGKAGHAYLFVGTRGTGKTSLAKIFARAISCQSPVDGEACEECPSCRLGASPNIVEIDAASNNGVDNVRALREEVRHPPITGRLRVYIIDEVHMLSSGAFNALLKTLEEPPPHAYFILATTEAHKLPATVASRCQRFNLRRIGLEDMKNALQGYMQAEGIDIDPEALEYVAMLADGAMRDALSILDHAIGYFLGERITAKSLRELLGAVDEDVMFALTEAISQGDAAACIGIVERLSAEGRELRQFVEAYVRHLRDMLVLCVTGRLEAPAGRLERLGQAVAGHSPKAIMHLVEAFAQLSNRMRQGGHERTALEVCCLMLVGPASQAVPAPATAPTLGLLTAFWQMAEGLRPILRRILQNSIVEAREGGLSIVAQDEVSAQKLQAKHQEMKARLDELLGASIDITISYAGS